MRSPTHVTLLRNAKNNHIYVGVFRRTERPTPIYHARFRNKAALELSLYTEDGTEDEKVALDQLKTIFDKLKEKIDSENEKSKDDDSRLPFLLTFSETIIPWTGEESFLAPFDKELLIPDEFKPKEESQNDNSPKAT